MYGIDGVIGAIDGSHVKIRKDQFPNIIMYIIIEKKIIVFLYKKEVCHHQKKFISFFFFGKSGSIHDSCLLKKSFIQKGYIHGFFDKNFLLGNSAYPCLDWLIVHLKTMAINSKSKNI